MLFSRSVVFLINFILTIFFLYFISAFLRQVTPPSTTPSLSNENIKRIATTSYDAFAITKNNNSEIKINTEEKPEMKIHYAISKHDRLVDVMVHKNEEMYQSEGLKRINDHINQIQRENNNKLPVQSYFNTTNSSKICQNLDTAKCVPKLQNSKSMLYFVPSMNLLTCLITKNMSTMLRAMMCYLLNPNKFLASGRLIHTELNNEGGFCRDGNFFWTYEMEKVSAKNFSKTIDDLMIDWKPFVFVRDPFDRVLSAYIDKCLRDLRRPIPKTKICNGCGKNITCFLMREYDRMMKSYGWNPSTFEDLHFFPQNWECNFAQFIDKYQIVLYNSANVTSSIEQLIGLLNERNIDPEYVEHIKKDLNAGRTQHQTIDSKARQFLENRVRNSPFLMEFIVRMYYWDYQLFNYSLPLIKFKY